MGVVKYVKMKRRGQETQGSSFGTTIDYLKVIFINDCSKSFHKEIMDLVASCEKQWLQEKIISDLPPNIRIYREVLQKPIKFGSTYEKLKIHCSEVRGFIRSLPDHEILISKLDRIVNKLAKTMALNDSIKNLDGQTGLNILRQQRQIDPKFIANRFTYNTLIKKDDITGNQVLEIFGHMRQDGIEPNAFAYACLISKTDITAAQGLGLLQEMKKKGIVRNRMVYDFLLRKKDLPANKALILLGEMEKDGIEKSLRSYNAILAKKDIRGDRALFFYDLIKKRSKRGPNIFTYNLLFTKIDIKYQKIRELMIEMAERRIKPDETTTKNLRNRGDMSEEEIDVLLQEIFGT